MYWLLGLHLWTQLATAHQSAPFGPSLRPVLSAPARVTYRGHALSLSDKEHGFLNAVLNAPNDFAPYESLHAWAGWTTKFNASRVRSFAKNINLKTLEYAGAFALTDDPAAGGLRLATPPPAETVAPDDRVRAWLNAVNEKGELRVTERQYVALGLPRADLIRAIERVDPKERILQVTFELMTWASIYRRHQPSAMYWYPRPKSAACRDHFDGRP